MVRVPKSRWQQATSAVAQELDPLGQHRKPDRFWTSDGVLSCQNGVLLRAVCWEESSQVRRNTRVSVGTIVSLYEKAFVLWLWLQSNGAAGVSVWEKGTQVSRLGLGKAYDQAGRSEFSAQH